MFRFTCMGLHLNEYSKKHHNQAVITVQTNSKQHTDRVTVLISVANNEITSLWFKTVQE